MRISARKHREAREPMPEPHEKTKYIISESCYITIPVIMAVRTHLFPFRTQKLSSLAPKVLVGTPTGRIGRCRISINKRGTLYLFYLFIYSNYPPGRGRTSTEFTKQHGVPKSKQSRKNPTGSYGIIYFIDLFFRCILSAEQDG